MLRILFNVTTVSQALEQQKRKIKIVRINLKSTFFVYNAVDVGNVFTKTFQNFKNRSLASKYSELFQLSPHYRHCLPSPGGGGGHSNVT